MAPGPALLAGLADGPSLAAHRDGTGDPPSSTSRRSCDLVSGAGVRGRGGAAFPFATKLATAARRSATRRGGQPRRGGARQRQGQRPGASAPPPGPGRRDRRPRAHWVLARSTSCCQANVPTPDGPWSSAVAERDDRIRLILHTADERFVAGQARAVLELMAARPNLPVTAWQPEAVAGHRGRPTLLSNAETWAQVGLLVLDGAAAYAPAGHTGRAGHDPADPQPAGVPPRGARGRLRHSVDRRAGAPSGRGRRCSSVASTAPGRAWETLGRLSVSPAGMIAAGTPLGAGVVHSSGAASCSLVLHQRRGRLPRRAERWSVRSVLQRTPRPRPRVPHGDAGAGHRRTGRAAHQPRGPPRRVRTSGRHRASCPLSPHRARGRGRRPRRGPLPRPPVSLGSRHDQRRSGSTGPPAGRAGCVTSCCRRSLTLDEWGYPLVGGDLTEDLLADARAAVRACPQLALRIVE